MTQLNPSDASKEVNDLLTELEYLDFKLSMKPHMPAQLVDRREQVIGSLGALGVRVIRVND